MYKYHDVIAVCRESSEALVKLNNNHLRDTPSSTSRNTNSYNTYSLIRSPIYHPKLTMSGTAPLVDPGLVYVAYQRMADQGHGHTTALQHERFIRTLMVGWNGAQNTRNPAIRRVAMVASYFRRRYGDKLLDNIIEIKRLANLINTNAARSMSDFDQLIPATLPGTAPIVPALPPAAADRDGHLLNLCLFHLRGWFTWDLNVHDRFAHWAQQRADDPNVFLPRDELLNCWEFALYALVIAGRLPAAVLNGAYGALIRANATDQERTAVKNGLAVLNMLQHAANPVLYRDIANAGGLAMQDFRVGDVVILPEMAGAQGAEKIHHVALVVEDMQAGGGWKNLGVMHLTESGGEGTAFADCTTLDCVVHYNQMVLVRL
ncbi:hypothetical protein B0T16DRAFT_416756 [Cercophora newfieldiana]|uniref:Uncharacterized protein n=1 Tax=Cercophora newfieldiana TaxID=92897 RepID=A0AA39Y165_9PEZI|nr:hypothetical protein B0T16DRAFT_416756 [Cercophora newfieldiana]